MVLTLAKFNEKKNEKRRLKEEPRNLRKNLVNSAKERSLKLEEKLKKGSQKKN